MALPAYADLPVAAGAPGASSWGLWGADDACGCLNLCTPARARDGLAAALDGRVFNLNLELELPDPPLFGRPAFTHVVHGLGPTGHDDELMGWNTQRSSQWDGFRHLGHPVHGFYNGVADGDHGVHHWARRGIVTRGVLADVARWRAAQGRPLVPDAESPITPDDLTATLGAAGVTVEPGDVLVVRTGWLAWYRGLDAAARAGAVDGVMAGCVGLARGEAMAAALWDLHVAAVAADNPALEVMPFGRRPPGGTERWADHPGEAADVMLHFSLLGLLGLPIGELFDLDALADHLHAEGRATFLLTSAPLNLEAGVATPPNALAVT